MSFSQAAQSGSQHRIRICGGIEIALTFLYDNILFGVLVLLVGFVFHWMEQALSVFNWDLTRRLGLQEKEALPEYRVYEHAIAVADTSIGWLYGLAGVGPLFEESWGYKLSRVPGVLFVYHGISFLDLDAEPTQSWSPARQPIAQGWLDLGQHNHGTSGHHAGMECVVSVRRRVTILTSALGRGDSIGYHLPATPWF